jgi:hypothetical protein
MERKFTRVYEDEDTIETWTFNLDKFALYKKSSISRLLLNPDLSSNDHYSIQCELHGLLPLLQLECLLLQELLNPLLACLLGPLGYGDLQRLDEDGMVDLRKINS